MTGAEGPHRWPRRRRTDHPWWRRLAFRPFENWYRDVVLVLVVIACGYAVHLAVGSADKADRAASTAIEALSRVQQGRRVALGVSCAINSAVSQAGKETIENGGGLPPRLELFLEAHGYPPVSVRRRQAERSAAAYVRSISQRIHKQVGHKGDGLIRSDGTVDCPRLEAIAAVPVADERR